MVDVVIGKYTSQERARALAPFFGGAEDKLAQTLRPLDRPDPKDLPPPNLDYWKAALKIEALAWEQVPEDIQDKLLDAEREASLAQSQA